MFKRGKISSDLSLIKSDGLLLLVAIIWGFAFVAQRSSMEVIGPFAFNGVWFGAGHYGASEVHSVYWTQTERMLGMKNIKGIYLTGECWNC